MGVSPGQPITPLPTPSMLTTPGPNPYYQYAEGHFESARATAIDRTKTGLLLIAIGFFIGWIPLVGVVGGIPELVGAIMVILGRHAFGREHARNVMWSIIIFIIAIVVAIVAVFAIVFSAIVSYHLNSTNRELPPSFGPYFIGTFFDVILIGIAIFGIAQVLFTYALQKRNGRILLYCGYVSIVVANSLDFFVLIKTPYLSSLPLVVPGILYGYAYYLARDRIIRGEVPAPAAPVQGQGTPASNI
ncbi:hypothetical protein E6H13_05665 [Candidatus Bathyarchaeota archaeon]|nr:MAG: hypothetical protein E6H13_05665 [Candidatus Bathyarchaeota archaeon]